MASHLLGWVSFPYCGPTAEPCPTDTIKLDPKDFVKNQPAAANFAKDSETFSCLPSVSAAALALEEVRLRPLNCAEPSSPEGAAASQLRDVEPEQEELFLDDDAESQRSPSASLAQFLSRKSEDMSRSYSGGVYGNSPCAISPVTYPATVDPSLVRDEGYEVAEEEMQGEDMEEAFLVTDQDVVEESFPSREPDPRSRTMPADFRFQAFDMDYKEAPPPGDVIVDDALAVEEPDELEDEAALALANSHLQHIEAELRSHRDVISREVEARRRLEDALLAERRRAEVEAQGRRKLQQEIEAGKRRIEDERRLKMEAEEMAVRLEEQRRLEEELDAARRRAEEEARLVAQRCEEQRRQAEKKRQLQEMEQKARESAAQAKKERERRERVRAFLAAEGYRHVRAARKKWSPIATYPLHRAVQCNDPEVVRLLLWMGANPASSNAFGQTPARLAKWLNRRDSHAEIIEALKAHSGDSS
mmetsp:Transcript_17705/g.42057  ORF Transcript_17705/g.42057 Transcript_17705/m.42057 type:complete len:474 (+) Transcript_17705:87-1508(+)